MGGSFVSFDGARKRGWRENYKKTGRTIDPSSDFDELKAHFDIFFI